MPLTRRYDLEGAVRVGVGVSLVLFVVSLAARFVPSPGPPPDLQRAGEAFVGAFVRPLIDPGSSVPPVLVRLKFIRRSEQLEIHFAPNHGRRYPNLLDHKRNVEYDVGRVLHLLGPDVTVSNPLRAQGKWVVVPIRLVARKQDRCVVNILLLSTGGGGANILRSLKTLFERDVAIAQQDRSRVRRTAAARDHDAVSRHQRVLAGAGAAGRAPADRRGRRPAVLGSRHSPSVAVRALEESRDQIEQLIEPSTPSSSSIGTGGKGTGAGTMFPLARDRARGQHKLVLPVFVRPSFERHEVDKRRYDHALHVAAAVRRRAHPADRDPQRPCLLRPRSAAAVSRLGTDEPAHRARAARAAVRAVGSVAGRSVRSVDPAGRTMDACASALARSLRHGAGRIRATRRFARPLTAAGRTRTAPSAGRLARRSSASRATGRIWRTRRSRAALRRSRSPTPAGERTTRSTRARSTRRSRGESRHCSPNTPAFTSRLRSTGQSTTRPPPALARRIRATVRRTRSQWSRTSRGRGDPPLPWINRRPQSHRRPRRFVPSGEPPRQPRASGIS